MMLLESELDEYVADPARFAEDHRRTPGPVPGPVEIEPPFIIDTDPAPHAHLAATILGHVP